MRNYTKLVTLAMSALCSAAICAPTEALDFREVVSMAKQKVAPAVLYVKCLIEDTDYGVSRTVPISGSAVIISTDGEFVTNWHVVDKAKKIRCLLSDGRHFDAKRIGSDKSTDLALCKLIIPEGESLPVTKFGDSSKLDEGSFVLALGAPYGLNRSVTFGTISCRSRYLEDHSEYNLWLQTDAGIGPGNSGGPLINTDGEIVGINALGMSGFSGAAFGFAIPSNVAVTIIDQLRKSGDVNWSWTGLMLQPIRDFDNDTFFDIQKGVLVAGAVADSPAAQAGIQPMDVILSVNGSEVNAMSTEDLPAIRFLFGFLPENEDIHLSILRGSENIELTIKPCAKGTLEGQEKVFSRWDFTAKEINQFETPFLFMQRKNGIYISAVKSRGNSYSVLHEEDIILSVNGKEIKSMDDLQTAYKDAIDNVDKQHRALFLVLRNSREYRFVVDFLKETL